METKQLHSGPVAVGKPRATVTKYEAIHIMTAIIADLEERNKTILNRILSLEEKIEAMLKT